MNFFEQQKQARSQSKMLWVLFLLAVVAILVAVNFAGWVGYEAFKNHSHESSGYYDHSYSHSYSGSRDGEYIAVFALTTLTTLLVILLGSLFKTASLRSGGGASVAKSLGARRVEMDTTEPAEKRLVNVVEEMAIASGSNVPSIWILDQDPCINAFAAGYAPSEAAVCVSQGCLTELTRDELQGVIAHEFSHIFNGDMRANIRMLGVLHGILVIGLTGYWAVRILGHSSPRSRSSNKKDNAGAVLLAILIVGILLIFIGWVGVFFGRLIKASLSRTREYLADASAVQFTRNPSGIAGALAKIHLSAGSKLSSSNREEFSHFFFADGVGFHMPFFETHPPLPARLDRILPNWSQVFQKDKLKSAPDVPPLTQVVRKRTKTMDEIGQTAVEQIAYAKQLLDGLPAIIHKLSAVPQGAKLLIVALLTVEHGSLPAGVAAYAAEYPVDALADARQRLKDAGQSNWLPVANMCMPAIQNLKMDDRKAFLQTCSDIVNLDGNTTTFEASILSLLERSLASSAQKRRVSHNDVQKVRSQIFSLAAIMAAETSDDETQCYEAFRRGLQHANLPGYIPERLPEVSPEALPGLLKPLSQSSLEIKETTMSVLVEVMKADGKISPIEREILRTVAVTLECPLPPL